MIELPKRRNEGNPTIYEEIEQFKDYEFTNCIAFEMAIRNKEVKELIRFTVFKKWTEEIRAEWQKKSNKLYYYLLDVKKLTTYYNEKFKNINFNKEEFIFNRKEDENNFIKSDELLSILYTNVNPKNNFFKSRVVNSFSRPEMTLLPKQSFPTFTFNFNLPKEELIAYISKIKDTYDKDNSIVKTPLELLGEDLEKSDNKRTQKKSNAEKYADWFYIYDYWTFEKMQGKTDKEIFVNLEVENDIPYKEENIRKIRDKMIYFIDKLGYKELITGFKNS
jgi:hypothetical protein